MIQTITTLMTRLAAACPNGDFFGFPTWHKYLEGQPYTDTVTGGFTGSNTTLEACRPIFNKLSDVWLILAAVIEILLRVGVFLAIGFIIWGGIQFIIGQGEPDKVSAARGTIINAVVGLVVAIVASAVITFVAGRFTG